MQEKAKSCRRREAAPSWGEQLCHLQQQGNEPQVMLRRVSLPQPASSGKKGILRAWRRSQAPVAAPESCGDALVWSSLEQTKGAGDCQMTQNNDSGSSKQF